MLERTPPSARALTRAVDRLAPQWAKQLTDAGADANARPQPWEVPALQMAPRAPGTDYEVDDRLRNAVADRLRALADNLALDS